MFYQLGFIKLFNSQSKYYQYQRKLVTITNLKNSKTSLIFMEPLESLKQQCPFLQIFIKKNLSFCFLTDIGFLCDQLIVKD